MAPRAGISKVDKYLSVFGSYTTQRGFGVSTMKRSILTIFMLLLVASMLANTVSVAGQPKPLNEQTLHGILQKVDLSNIKQHFNALTSFDTRFTGYEGYYMAVDYVKNYLEKTLHLKVILHPFNVVVPLDEGSIIERLDTGEKIQVHALLPNLVQTSSGTIEGELVYYEKGSQVDVKDKIVILDYNSGWEWLQMASLGAKAVVFLEPMETNFQEGLSKFLTTPINFTRVYVGREDVTKIKRWGQEHVQVKLTVKMKFEETEAYNVIGILEGDKSDEVIAIASYLDSWSPVPGQAPGIDSAFSTASLLEIARVLSDTKPLRTIWFVFFGGHWQGIEGARAFVRDYYFSEEVQSGNPKIWMLMELDFTPNGRKPALVDEGYFYSYDGGGRINILVRFKWIKSMISEYSKVFSKVVLGQELPTQKIFDDGIVEEQYFWWASIPEPYFLDTEALTICGGLGFTLYTGEVLRPERGVPVYPLDKVISNINNIVYQTKFALTIIYGFANEPSENWGISWGDIKGVKYGVSRGSAVALYSAAGFSTLRGKTVEYSMVHGKYVPIGKALVVVHRGGLEKYPYLVIYKFTDEKGNFKVDGLAPYSGMNYYGGDRGYYFEGYILDDKGRIIYAPDHGLYGTRTMSNYRIITSETVDVLATMFKVESRIYLFDLVDPFTLTRPLSTRHMNPDTTWTSASILLTPFKADTLSEPMKYYTVVRETTGVVFLPEEVTRLTLMIKYGPLGQILGLLIDIPVTEETRISNTLLKVSENVYTLTKERYDVLKESFIKVFTIEEALNEARILLENAATSLQSFNYSGEKYGATFGWLWSLKAYFATMSAIRDIVGTSTIFFAILLPFVFFFERLALNFEGYKRFGAFVALSAVLLYIFSLIHPAAKLASNIYVGFVGIILGGIFIIILLLFAEEFRNILKELRRKILGEHFIEKGTISSMLLSFSVAIENMRVRKLRTFLVLLTIAVTVFSLVSLSSFSFVISVYDKQPVSLDQAPQYEGVLLKLGTGEPGTLLDPKIIEDLNNMLGDKAIIAPRVWAYPPTLRNVVQWVIEANNRTTTIHAILGLSPYDPLNPVKLKTSDVSFFFTEESKYVCFVPREMAEALGVETGDKIKVNGIELTVLGVYDARIYDKVARDVDGTEITPLNPERLTALFLQELPQEELVPLPSSDLIIVPASLAIEMGGNIASIVVMSNNTSFLINFAENLAAHTSFTTTISLNGEVYHLQYRTINVIRGLEYLIIPLVIGSLNIFITVLGNIKEREREIGIYSALGLSPRGVSALFLVETLTYGFTAVVPGYILGIIFNIYLVSNNLLPPGFSVNYTSSAEVYAIGFTLLATIAGVIYPIYKVSKVVTPSFERKWKITTKPVGDRWEIPLPLSIPSETEAKGILLYLYEYLRALTVESDQPFIVREIGIVPDKQEIRMKVALKPLESNVTQTSIISIYKQEENKFGFVVFVERLTGRKMVWKSSNYRFIDSIRKQLLTWRLISPQKRREYIQKVLKGIWQ